MKKKLLAAFILIAALVSYDASAQSFLKKLENTAKSTLKKEVNKAVDKAKQAVTKGKQNNQSQPASQSNQSQQNSFYVLEVTAPVSQGTTLIEYGPIVGEHNGHMWVDLGLPSGLRWAVSNIDASSAEQPGKFYAWGETVSKSSYTVENCSTNGKVYQDISANKSLDVATQKWGKGWRMPTEQEYCELLNFTFSDFVQVNGKYGRRHSNTINDNTMFLPAAGEMDGSSLKNANGCGNYWTSSPINDHQKDGAHMMIYNAAYQYMTTYERRLGGTIRAVMDYDVNTEIPYDGTTSGHNWVDLGLPSGLKWATCNVGSDEVDQVGYYFRWGGIKNYFDDFSYANEKVQHDISEYVQYDAARAKWGDNWRMPTAADFVELIENCTWEWTNLGRRKGLKATSKINGKYIFIPASGECRSSAGNQFPFGTDQNKVLKYWTSTNMEGWQNQYDAYYFTATSDKVRIASKIRHEVGYSIRPVTDSDNYVSNNQQPKQSNKANVAAPVASSGKIDNVPSSGKIDGHDWVDLGLPSGTKWATANLGATSAKEVGDTYEWAEVTPTSDLKSQKNLVRGKWISGIGGNATYDAASAKWGGEWRMPTKGSFKELFENCTWELTSLGNIKGYKVTSKINGNYIFLPFNSNEDITNYWCSTPAKSDKNDTADALSINGGEYGLDTPDRAEYSFIRPVIKP